MLKHLKVPESKAQETKAFLEDCKALNEGFLPIKQDGYVLWPLNFEVEGEIIVFKLGVVLFQFDGDVVTIEVEGSSF